MSDGTSTNTSAKAHQCITFLTDYGLDDGFVASCHGVAARIAPDVRIIDITHLVPAGDVRRGAAVLAQTVPYLPPGVHVAVVDPGVGTSRRAIAIEAGDRIFVGPDNGLLSWAARGLAPGGTYSLAPWRTPAGESTPAANEPRAFELTNSKLWLDPVSPTFHGRDIFTPVAAQLAGGLDISAVGRPVDPASLITLPSPTRRVQNGGAEGEVLTVDRFGNIQLSLTRSDLDQLGAHPGDSLTITLGVTARLQGSEPQRRRTFSVPYRETFGSVPPGELVAYADSVGCVALAVNSGDAAQRLGLPPGARIRISPTP
ncbi:SAM hydrolase/SAM-dependent halogenase family protein [Actinomadura rudentiformis]|uniref:SAM hydrolase/SAM-dependent halogenase family protein n=1 Tax=Actinomadura rudentiformis TaxID=359158 RepID=UPI001CEF89D2|nr:SAM-dependent chlorinase/fluorinase [Actinomadura rudentiformis]